MIDDPLFERLRELSWRRPLTAAEQTELRAWLAAHPEARADWETEVSLNRALERLPDVAVASNFTARVLRELERDTAAARRRTRTARSWWQSWSHWLPKSAVAAVFLGVGLFTYQQSRLSKREELVRSLEAVSEVSSLTPEVLKDFDTIAALGRTSANPAADEELLKLLQ